MRSFAVPGQLWSAPGIISPVRPAAGSALSGIDAIVDGLAVGEWKQQATTADIRAVLQARTLAEFDEATILGAGTSAFANDAAVETAMGATATWHPCDFTRPLIYATGGMVLYPPRGGHGGKQDSCFIKVDAATGACTRTIDGSGMRPAASGAPAGSYEHDSGGAATSLYAGVRKADHDAGDDDRNAFLPSLHSYGAPFVAGDHAYLCGDSAGAVNLGDHAAQAVYKYSFLTDRLSVHLVSANSPGATSTTKRGWHSDSSNRVTVYDGTDTGAGVNDRVFYHNSGTILYGIIAATAGTTTHPDAGEDAATGPALYAVGDGADQEGMGVAFVQPGTPTRTAILTLRSDGSGAGSTIALFTGIKPIPWVKATDRNTGAFTTKTTANDPLTMRTRGRNPNRRAILWDSENIRALVWDGGPEINVLTPSSGITTWTWSELASAGGVEPNIAVDSGTGYDYLAMALIPGLANDMRAVICACDEGVWIRRLA